MSGCKLCLLEHAAAGDDVLGSVCVELEQAKQEIERLRARIAELERANAAYLKERQQIRELAGHGNHEYGPDLVQCVKRQAERITELEQDVKSYKATCGSLETRLRDATKAGTPYAAERDSMNAMVLRIAELEVALLCERCNGRGWYIVSDGSDQGMKVACLKCKAFEIRNAAKAMEGRDE